MYRRASFVTALLVAMTACSGSGPQAVRPGTPAYFWAAANETFKKGDHPKTSDYLTKVSSSKDYIQRAQPWQMIIDAGVAQGYMDLADRFETGAGGYPQSRCRSADRRARV